MRRSITIIIVIIQRSSSKCPPNHLLLAYSAATVLGNRLLWKHLSHNTALKWLCCWGLQVTAQSEAVPRSNDEVSLLFLFTSSSMQRKKEGEDKSN